MTRRGAVDPRPAVAAAWIGLAAALMPAGAALAQATPAMQPAQAASEAGRRADLLGLYHDALAGDPTFAAARYARESAGELTEQARAALRPNINAIVTANENRFLQQSPPIGVNYWSWGPTLNATLPLYHPQLSDAVGQAELSVRQADSQYAQARQDLILRVTQAYFDVLAAQDAVEALESNKKATAENLAQARREFEVGTKTIVDTHEAQARADQIEAQDQVARGDLVVRRYTLFSIVGRDFGALLPLRDAPELVAPRPDSAETWAGQAEQDNPQVLAARAGDEIAHAEIERQKAGWRPTLDLQAQAGLQRYSGNVTDLTFNAINTQRQATIGLQLNVPIYTGGLVQSRVRAALADEERARQNLELARRTAALGARQAFVGATYGLSQVRALESAQVSARSQLDSTKLGYQVGVRINLEVLDAETQLVNTQRDLKRARYDFLLNGLRLQSAVGNLSEADIESINRLLLR
jgi:outer membrane protein